MHVQHQLGVELDIVQAGNQAGRQAGDHERQRRRHVEAAGHRGQQDRHHQYRQQ